MSGDESRTFTLLTSARCCSLLSLKNASYADLFVWLSDVAATVDSSSTALLTSRFSGRNKLAADSGGACPVVIKVKIVSSGLTDPFKTDSLQTRKVFHRSVLLFVREAVCLT